MLIIGCDFHSRYQQIAMARAETSELLLERRLDHQSGEAHAFYRDLQKSQEPVRVGIAQVRVMNLGLLIRKLITPQIVCFSYQSRNKP